MRIVHLSTYDVTGGAARAAYRLHRGLQELGHQSFMLVQHRRSDDPSVMAFTPPMDWVSRIRRRARREMISRNFARYRATRPAGYERFSDDRTRIGASLAKQLPACDLINLHLIAGFVDYRAFFAALPRAIPLIWRLADMNAFTGGCHFDHGCERHVVGCGECPQLGSRDANDLSNQIWRRKKMAFSRLEPARLHVVVLNRWMAETVRRNPLLGKFPVTIIPNGVDTNTFAPLGIDKARHSLGIPQEARVVLFVADYINNRRKGFSVLVQALNATTEADNLFLLSLGHGKPSLSSRIPHLHLGHSVDDRRLALAYSAADVYVIPSLQDNQPNTVLEAMACGTPVVGFNVGGIPDMVRSGITGLLAPAGDVDGLLGAIREILRCPARRAKMAANCRRIVMDEYRLNEQVRSYAQVYETVLKEVAAKSVASKACSILESS